MKLASIRRGGAEPTLGIREERGLLDVAAALEAYPSGTAIPTEMMEVIRQGDEAVAKLRDYRETLPNDADPSLWIDEVEATFAPCVSRPQKIICVGLNYRKHAEETKAPIPEVPILFSKFANALAGHREEIVIPAATRKLDYEAELAIVIGRQAKNVTREDALSHVFGYAAANDLSARDLQNRTTQWMLGKTCDGFCPLGPYLVTADEAGDPNRLGLRTYVNGELRQNSNTSDMIFPCDEIVSYVSRHLTLEPGDVILTGTPEGVVIGMPWEQRVYLQPGDVVSVEVEKLGTLTNRFVAE